MVWVQALALGTSVCRGPGKRRGGQRKKKKKCKVLGPIPDLLNQKFRKGAGNLYFFQKL